MRTRKLWWVGAGLAPVALVAVGAIVLPPQGDPIVRGKCQQLRTGMTMAEAEAILGLPGDYSTKYHRNGIERHLDFHRTLDASGFADVMSDKPGTTTHHWRYEKTIVEVHYSASGLIAAVDCYSYAGQEQEDPDGLLARARRLWRHWFPERPEAP
jgi:hypothetical protein